MRRFIDLTGVKPRGFRAFFYLHNSMTFKALSALNFGYDSSKTIFKPTHYSLTRVRVARKVKPFRIHGVREIPVTGDQTYDLSNHNYHHSLRWAWKDFEWARSQRTLFVLNNHPNSSDVKVLFRFLKTFTKEVRAKTDFLRLSDIGRLYQWLLNPRGICMNDAMRKEDVCK